MERFTPPVSLLAVKAGLYVLELYFSKKVFAMAYKKSDIYKILGSGLRCFRVSLKGRY